MYSRPLQEYFSKREIHVKPHTHKQKIIHASVQRLPANNQTKLNDLLWSILAA